jgi:RNA ligase
MFFIPSYEFCKDICEKTNNDVFYESKFIIDGYDISIFNYRIATYQDFLEYQAFELRGLTFVFNKDGSFFKRFLLMEKFFNLNENESTSIDLVKNKKIKSVFFKEDGSIINFIQLPNGRILAKSKWHEHARRWYFGRRLFSCAQNNGGA